MPFFENKNPNPEKTMMIMCNNISKPKGIDERVEYSDDSINIINENGGDLAYIVFDDGKMIMMATSNWIHSENFMMSELEAIYETDDNPVGYYDVWSDNDVLQNLGISDARARELSSNKKWKRRFQKLNKKKLFMIPRNFSTIGFQFNENGEIPDSEPSNINSGMIDTNFNSNAYLIDEVARLAILGREELSLGLEFDIWSNTMTEVNGKSAYHLYWCDWNVAMNIEEDDDDGKAEMEYENYEEKMEVEIGHQHDINNNEDDDDDDDCKMDDSDENVEFEIKDVTGVASEVGSHEAWFQCTLKDQYGQFVENDPEYIGWERFMCPRGEWIWDDDTAACIIDFLIKNNAFSIV